MLLRATGSMNLHRVYSLQFTVYSLQSIHVPHHTRTFILSLVSGDIFDCSATCSGALQYIINLFAKLVVSRLSPSKILALVNKLSQQTLSFS